MAKQKPPDRQSQKYVTIKLAAEILRVSPNTLRNWDRQGKLKTKRHPKNNYRLYDISQLEQFASQINLKRPPANTGVVLRN